MPTNALKPMTRAQYRRHLNDEGAIVGNWKNRRHGQRTRLYGDYLWHQDREMFEVNYADYLRSLETK